MLLKTHLMFAILLILVFIHHVNNKFIFVFMVVLATILPDIDSGFSTAGKTLGKPLQLFVDHRGVIHSFTTAVLLSVLLAFIFPVTSLGFFVGYSAHLITDSFTKDGIQPFWPLKAKSNGFIRTGGKLEESMFFSLILINIFMFFIIYILG